MRLPSDNTPLSRPTNDALTEANSGLTGVSHSVRTYVRDAISENTRRAYRADLEHFATWGGTIPATDAMIADYLADHAEHLAVSTLVRRVAALSKAHAARGLTSPTRSELVKSTLRGIKRAHTSLQRQARPLLKEDLVSILAAMGERPKDLRDRALLLLGFAGGFRRSELIATSFTDIEHVKQGMVVTIQRSKTDQEGKGRKVGIPYARGRYCPVLSLTNWLEAAEIEDGAIFRPVDRHGRVEDARLSGEAVSLVIKERVALIGLVSEEFSGHSLRAGLATSAAAAGVSSWKIRQQTGHASDAMLARYIRDGEMFVGNAAGALL